MTDHTTGPTWLTDVTAHLGTPQLAEPDGIGLGDRIRYYWLWFPQGINHNLAIDRYADNRWEVIAGGKTGAVRWYGTTEPTDGQLRALCSLVGLLDVAWPAADPYAGCDRTTGADGRCGKGAASGECPDHGRYWPPTTTPADPSTEGVTNHG